MGLSLVFSFKGISLNSSSKNISLLPLGSGIGETCFGFSSEISILLFTESYVWNSVCDNNGGGDNRGDNSGDNRGDNSGDNSGGIDCGIGEEGIGGVIEVKGGIICGGLDCNGIGDILDGGMGCVDCSSCCSSFCSFGCSFGCSFDELL